MNFLFKELFIFTDAGLCLYNWKSEQITQSTDSSLIGGLLFAVSEFTMEAFSGARLQRLDLDNSKLIMTAHEFDVANPGKESTQKKTLIFGALVDSRDNNHLIQELLTKIGNEVIDHYDPSGIKPMDKNMVDPKINTLLKAKTFSRSKIFVTLGVIISALGIFIGSIALSLNWQYFVPASLIDYFNVIPVIISTFGIVFIGSMLIGEKNKAVKLIVAFNTVFSIFLIVFFDNFLKSQYFGTIGSWYVYMIFIILITFTSALFGSLQTERKFLFPE